MPAVPVAIQGVSKAYVAGRPVLQGIDLRVEPGELFFLLGESGCGKTTLLRIVAGFLAPDAGTVRFGDQEVSLLPPERRDLGMVFQNYALWPHLDVAGNVAFPLEVRRLPAAERRQRVEEALALVELPGFGARRIGELSGGQQQRVALARAIVARPGVLLLDEPLSNLDPRLRASMRQEIRRVCKAAGVTALYVTHDQGEALSTADRIALLVQGRLEQVGAPRELYERPRSVAAARFLGEANILDPAQAARLAPGLPAAARYCLRPEHIAIAAEGVEARVVGGSYQGERAVWQVEAAGIVLTVSEAAPPARQAGDPVRLRCDPAHLVPLEGG